MQLYSWRSRQTDYEKRYHQYSETLKKVIRSKNEGLKCYGCVYSLSETSGLECSTCSRLSRGDNWTSIIRDFGDA